MTALDRMDFDLQVLPELCPALSEAFCRMIAEACAVCLDDQGHTPGVVMGIRQKARQTDRSGGVLPALIAVVEFGHPISFLQRRDQL